MITGVSVKPSTSLVPSAPPLGPWPVLGSTRQVSHAPSRSVKRRVCGSVGRPGFSRLLERPRKPLSGLQVARPAAVSGVATRPGSCGRSGSLNPERHHPGGSARLMPPPQPPHTRTYPTYASVHEKSHTDPTSNGDLYGLAGRERECVCRPLTIWWRLTVRPEPLP